MRRLFALIVLLSAMLSNAQEAISLQTAESKQISIQAESPTRLIFEGSANQYITISAIALATDETRPDVVLWVLDPHAHLIAYNDNQPNSSNPRIENLFLVEAGQYIIYVDSFNGVSAGEVEILIEESNPFNLVSEMAENSIHILAELPASQILTYHFDAPISQVHIIAKDASGNLDPYLRLLDSSGEILAENDDHDSPMLSLDLFDAYLSHEITEADSYTIEVLDFLGRAGHLDILIEILN